MRRAVVAPLLSGLVIPGLGQIVNRQVGKGALLMAGSSLLFMVGLGLAFHQVSQAVLALEGQAPADKWAALRAQLLSQGTGWLWVLLAALAALWLFAVLDAWRWGRRRDQEAGGEIKI
ncbi:MAG: hypothetical protein C4525_11355 [Desulfarculus sp.]|nr:MAG: hypothetical protein C4525_11355 [Desulfarculus sp.]